MRTSAPLDYEAIAYQGDSMERIEFAIDHPFIFSSFLQRTCDACVKGTLSPKRPPFARDPQHGCSGCILADYVG